MTSAAVGLQPSLFTTPLIAVTVTFSCLSTVAVGLRFYARNGGRPFQAFLDDWLIVATLVVCWAMTINEIAGAAQCGIDTAKVGVLRQTTVTVRTLWIEGFLLATVLALVKISILHFYYRIFVTKCGGRFKWSVRAMYFVIISWWLSSILCQILVTDPIRGAYTPTIPFKFRYNFTRWNIVFAIMSLFFDVVILCFPLPVIRRLKIDFKRKMSVIGIFWLGAFCCVAAAVRLYYVLSDVQKVADGHVKHTNPYKILSQEFIWVHIEPNCSIIAACLPTYGALFRSGLSMHSLINSVKSMFSMELLRSSSSSRTRSTKAANDSQNSLTRDGQSYEFSEGVGSKSTVEASDLEAGKGTRTLGAIEVTTEWKNETH